MAKIWYLELICVILVVFGKTRAEGDAASHASNGTGIGATRVCPPGPRRHASAEAFVREWVSNPGPEVCGQWQVSFKKLHDAIRSGADGTEKRYVTYRDPWRAPRVKPGIGDHLLGMVSAFLVALLTDRAFVMEDSALTEHVGTSEIDWRLKSDVPMEIGATEVSYYNYGKSWTNSVMFPTDVLAHFKVLENAENIKIATNGGVLSRIFSDTSSETYRALESLGLRLPSAFGCIVRFLVTPKSEIWQPILPQVRRLIGTQTSSIGIHMRTADRFAWKTGHTSITLQQAWETADAKLLRCAKDVGAFNIPDLHRTVWLFLSDSVELRRRVEEHYPDLVVPTTIEPEHLRFKGKAAMASVLSEWLLLSMCDYFVINECGFSKTSVAFSLKRPKVFLFDHYVFGGADGECDQAHPSSLLDFRRWSGL